MNRKTIDDVRRELHRVKENARTQHEKDVRRAETAEREVIKQTARAEAYSGALTAVLEDMKRLGLSVSVNGDRPLPGVSGK